VITTNDRALAAKLVSLRDYGKGPTEDMESVGLSARLSELLAVLAYKNLRHLKALRAERAKLAKRYKKELQDLKGIAFQEWGPDRKSGHNYFVFRVTGDAARTRDELLEILKSEGIECKRYFYPALHQLTAYRGYGSGNFRAAEQLCREVAAVPLYSGMRE
jgi:dTDP-4-amino-4,6-dideoxygalactose transaminase